MGSHLVMAGAGLATGKELFGHRDIQTTLWYAHLAQDHKQEAIGKRGSVLTNTSTMGKEKEQGAKAMALTP